MRHRAPALLLLLAASCSTPGLAPGSDPAGSARAAQFSSVEEQKVPYSGVMNYSDNWPDISDLRDRPAAQR